MPVQVYGCNHVVIEVTDAKKAVQFYSDVFGLKLLRGGEGAAWCKLGEHQFMAIFEVESLQPDRVKHFGLMVRDPKQINEVRRKLTNKYKLKLHPGFRCESGAGALLARLPNGSLPQSKSPPQSTRLRVD